MELHSLKISLRYLRKQGLISWISIVNYKFSRQWVSIVFIILTSVLLPRYSFSQTSVSVAPGIGVQTLHSYVIDNINADSRFRPDNLYATHSFNLSFQGDIKNNWMIFVGWSTYKTVISYKFSESGTNRWTKIAPPSNSVSFGSQKKVAVHKWLRLNHGRNIFSRIFKISDERYLLLFRSRIISGISHTWVNNIPGNMAATNPRNVSVFFGLGLQFFSDDKDMLQLNMFYSQGLKEITQVTVGYVLDGKEYYGVLGSKGSFFTVQIAYPFRLFDL